MGGRVEIRFYIGDRVIVNLPEEKLKDSLLSKRVCRELLQFHGKKGTVTNTTPPLGRGQLAYVRIDGYPKADVEPLFRFKWLERVTVLDLLADIDSGHH